MAALIQNSSPQRAAIAAWILLHIVSNCPGFYECIWGWNIMYFFAYYYEKKVRGFKTYNNFNSNMSSEESISRKETKNKTEYNKYELHNGFRLFSQY